MKRKRYTEEQIISILKEHEAGTRVPELSRRHGVSENTIETGGCWTARRSKWSRICLMTPASSMLAMTFILPPRCRQISMSTLNTRFKRCAQVMAARRSDAISTLFPRQRRALPPRVTLERRLLLGANTSWKRVRFTRGFGTSPIEAHLSPLWRNA